MSTIIDYKEGMELSSPMIIRGMPEDEYHAIERVSQTALKRWAVSCLDGMQASSFDSDASTAASMGSGVHSLLLDGHDMFMANYATGGPINKSTGEMYGRSTKKFQEWLKEQDGKKYLSDKEMESVTQMAGSIARDNFAYSVITMPGSERELTLLWSETINGQVIECKARLDWWNPDIGITDVKSTVDVDQDGFEKSVANRGWHVQSWFYPRGAVMTGLCETFPDYAWVVVENHAPYKTCCYKPDSPDPNDPGGMGWMQATGRTTAHKGLVNYAHIQAGGTPYTQTEGFTTINTKPWVWQNDEDMAAAGRDLR